MTLAAFLSPTELKGQEPEYSISPGMAVVWNFPGSFGTPGSHPFCPSPNKFNLGQRPLFMKREAFLQAERKVSLGPDPAEGSEHLKPCPGGCLGNFRASSLGGNLVICVG